MKVGFDILKSLGLRHRGVTIISCPSCARQGFDVIGTVQALEERLAHLIRVADDLSDTVGGRARPRKPTSA